MDRIIKQRMILSAQSLNNFYTSHFIPEQPAAENWLEVQKQYKALLGLGLLQGFKFSPFSVDDWWAKQKLFKDEILEKTKPLVFLELKAKQYSKDKQMAKAKTCIAEFKKLAPLISALVFEYLFGKNVFFAVYENKIVYKPNIIIP